MNIVIDVIVIEHQVRFTSAFDLQKWDQLVQ